MNSREEGFLLLTSHLGDMRRSPLTEHQLRQLERCVLRSKKPAQDKELQPEDLMAMGCSEEIAEKAVSLLSDQPQLHSYLKQGREAGCVPLSRISEGYPLRVKECLGMDAPGCLWLKGDMDLLNKPAVALVGSRNLLGNNEQFARQVGMLAAQYGLVLISGNARGADAAAQESCLGAGGCVISVVADSIKSKRSVDRILYVSEDGFDLPFTNYRALSRNRLIHSMAQSVFVAQCANGTGGTWDGTCRNLHGHWSPVICFADGSTAAAKLYKLGANLSSIGKLNEIFNEITMRIVRNEQ